MIFTFVSICIMTYAFVDFKKSFLMFLVFQMIWFPDANLINISGLPPINIGFFVSGFYCVMFFILKKKYKHAKKPFPFKKPMIFIGVSLLLTCFTSVTGFGTELAKAIGLIIERLFVIYLIWQMVETEKDFIYLFKKFNLVCFMAALYGLYEYLTQNNFILNYKFSLGSRNLNTYGETARGFRLYSFFEHPIAAAMTFGLFIVFICTCIIIYKQKIPNRKFAIVTCILSAICILLTKMRTGIFFFAIGLLAFVDLRQKNFYKIIILMCFLLLVGYPFLSNYSDIFSSFFSEKAQESIKGSTLKMRLDQFDAVFQLMKQSPVAGLGENFRSLVSNVYTKRALDYESLWLEQMAKHGIIGVIAYAYIIYYSVLKIPMIYKSRPTAIIAIAYWLTYSLTSTPYFRIYIYYLVIFFFLKKSKFYRESKLYMRNESIQYKVGSSQKVGDEP